MRRASAARSIPASVPPTWRRCCWTCCATVESRTFASSAACTPTAIRSPADACCSSPTRCPLCRPDAHRRDPPSGTADDLARAGDSVRQRRIAGIFDGPGAADRRVEPALRVYDGLPRAADGDRRRLRLELARAIDAGAADRHFLVRDRTRELSLHRTRGVEVQPIRLQRFRAHLDGHAHAQLLQRPEVHGDERRATAAEPYPARLGI